MRVNPESVYLELRPGDLIIKLSGEERTSDVVVVHWKDSNRWQRRNLIADEEQTIEDLLRALGQLYADEGSLEAFLDQLS